MSDAILDANEHDAFAGAPTFQLRHRLKRALWQIVWLLGARWTPPPLRRWRNFLLRLFGARIDRTANVYSSVSVWYPPNLEMARYASMGPGVICYSMERISIGEYAVVSQRAHLCTGTHDFDRPHFQLYARPIVIGAHAWIAAEAFVGPGVVVGEGAVIGARAVVTRKIAPWTVNAGNPARLLRARKRPGDAA